MSTPSHGHRASRRDLTALVAVVLVAIGAGAVALAVPGVAGAANTPGVGRGRVVTHASLACPALPSSAPHRTKSRLLVGSAPVTGVAGTGQVSAPDPVPLHRGALLRLAADPAGTSLRASGPIAAALFGFRVDRTRSTAAVASCVAPRAQWWFAGAGAGLDHASVLTMTNVDSGPAVVDLVVLGPEGRVQTIGTRGITIPPGRTHTVPMTAIAPQTDDLTVGVLASRGRVAAAVSDSYAATPGGSAGADWLTGTGAPSRRIRLAGVGSAGRPTVLVSNPSALEAVVGLAVLGPHGRFTPDPNASVSVPPGAVRLVDLGPTFRHLVGKNGEASVLVSSSVPVVATARETVGKDSSYAAPVSVLVHAAAAPLVGAGTVALTANELPGRATVTAYDASGTVVRATTLRVPARSTVSWTPKSGTYVVVRVQSGHLFGAVICRSAGTAVVPLAPLVIHLLQPPVVPGLR